MPSNMRVLATSRLLRVRYRYILEGFDKQWTQAGSRRNAYYTNLPPRHYRFRVQAANEDGIWNEPGAEVAFVIKPPFYRTLWFSGFATLLLAGIVFAIYRMRVRAIRSQFDAILAERNRIAGRFTTRWRKDSSVSPCSLSSPPICSPNLKCSRQVSRSIAPGI